MTSFFSEPLQNPGKKKKGIALILTLGVLFMMGVIVGSFAFFATSANKNTTEFMNTITATNLANSGYNYMVGAIQDFFQIVLPKVAQDPKRIEPDPKNVGTIRSNEFNSLQSALTAFLGGESVSFTNYQFIPEETAKELDELIFTNSDSWAIRYGFLPEGVTQMSQHRYNVDLDGINNYIYTTSETFTDSVQWKYAKTLLRIPDDDGTAVPDNAAAAFAIKSENIANEQRDADWHILFNETGNLFGRFAVMAKDQSSLINLESKLSQTGVDELIETMDENDPSQTLTPPQIADKRTDVTQNLQGNPTDLNDVMDELGLESGQTSNSFTTASSDNTQRIDVNTADPKEFYQYLNLEYDPSWDLKPDSEKVAIQSANAKISVNLYDYRDANCIPYALHKYSWNKEQLDILKPWNEKGLDDKDLFYGIEGMRISEVMIQPEQSFIFNGAPLKLKMTATSTKPSSSYFYEAQLPTLEENPPLYELQRDPNFKQWNQTAFSSSPSLEDGSVLLNLKANKKPIEITNPGGFYQVWIKMKITAKNPALGEAALEHYTNLDPKMAAPDITVKWASTFDTGGTQADIEEKSLVMALSSDLETEYNGIVDPVVFEAGVTTLAELYAAISDLKSRDILITGTTDSDLQTVVNEEMNFPNGASTSKPTDVQLNWDPDASDPSKAGTVDEVLSDKAGKTAEQLSEYAFGTRVLEVAMFDEGAGRAETGAEIPVLDPAGNPITLKDPLGGPDIELTTKARGNTPKDELIGVFYCFNTNGFTEDDKHIAGKPGAVDDKWKVEDDDYLWFCSTGVPRWLPYDELPEWMQTNLPNSTEKADVQHNSYYHTNDNACVFPRRSTKLKFRFRLVDFSDSRFNEQNVDDANPLSGGPDYELGVPKVAYTGFDSSSDPLTDLKGGKSIVGRPQWEDGDEVTVEIKEILATQQVYSTNLLEAPPGSDINPAPATYRELSETPDGLDQLHTVQAVPVANKFLWDQTLYYRNQRLEKNNRSANELHLAEYVELFNGTAQDVNMDGWILKVEQYKLIQDPDSPYFQQYLLLGPRYPDVIFKPNPANSDPSAPTPGTYEFTQASSSRPDYILLSNLAIPSNDAKNKIPFGLITNQCYSVEQDPDVPDEIKSENSSSQSFDTLRFPTGTDPVLGKFNSTSSFFGYNSKGAQFFSINLMTAWNYRPGEEKQLALFKTTNISPVDTWNQLTSGLTAAWDDPEAGSGYKWNNSSPFVFNPLHFRDDADRIVITLFAPKSPTKSFKWHNDSLATQGHLIYTPVNKQVALNGVPPQDSQPLFGLIEEREWLTAYPDPQVIDPALPPDEDSVESLAGTYAIVDRAVMDWTQLENNGAAEPAVETNHPNDWVGNRSVFLNRFYTNPLLLRLGVPGSMVDSVTGLGTPIPFEEAQSPVYSLLEIKDKTLTRSTGSSLTTHAPLANLASTYWSPHKQVFKAKPGPLGYGDSFGSPGYVLTARASPSQPDFIHTEFFKPDTQAIIENLKVPPDYAAEGYPTPTPTFPDLPINDQNILNTLGVSQSLREVLAFGGGFYDQQHTGFGSDSHLIFSYFFTKPEGAFIKDAPLSSVAELCDVPAPSIENNPLDKTTLSDESLLNSFVDGLESAGQYMTEVQKRKVFSAASADSTLLSPSVVTHFDFTTATSFNDVQQYETANPLVFPETGASYDNWTLQYTFYATVPEDKPTFKASFLPGRYKIFIEGLNPDFPIVKEDESVINGTWDVIKSIAIVTDGTLSDVTTDSDSSKVDNLKAMRRIGLTVVKGKDKDNTAIKNIEVLNADKEPIPITPDYVLQLLPSNGEEYFNIQNSLEVNFFSDTASAGGSQVLAKSKEYQQWNSSDATPKNKLQRLLSEVTTSPAFQGMRIHLVPREDVGKVNINTAPLHVLLRIPGFSHAVDTVDPSDPDIKTTLLTQGAANEIVQDIYQATHPTLKDKDGIVPEPYTFKDAGELLVYTNRTGPRAGPTGKGRLFPFLGSDEGIDTSKYSTETSRTQLANAKAKIFREAFPFIQYAGSSFEIVSLGQSVQPYFNDDSKLNVLSSNKISVTINLKVLLEKLSKQFIKDPYNIGKNTYADTGGDPVSQQIKTLALGMDIGMVEGDTVQMTWSKDGNAQYYIYPDDKSPANIQLEFSDPKNPSAATVTNWAEVKTQLTQKDL